MMYNQCVFEQLPIFNTFPTSVRNQQLNTCNRAATAAPIARSNVKFNTAATEEGLLLTLKKPLANKSQYKSELQSRIYEIKNKYSQIPKYSLVSDMWGNQYYVDVTAKIQEKMIEELNSIDMTNFGRRLSKQSFGDYELELNHDGSVLNISSERDSLNKNLQFGGSLKDFYVKSCTVEDESFAVLKVAIVLEKPIVAAAAADATTASSTGSDSLEKLINWAQEESTVRDNVKQQQKYDQLVGCSSMNECKKIQKKKDQEERNKKEQQEKARRSEIKRQKKLEQFKLRKQQEQEQKAKKEAYETKLVEEQRKKIEVMIQKQVSEEKQQAEIERKRQAATAATETQRIVKQQEVARQRAAAEEKQRLELRAKELAEKQKAAEIAQRKANEEAERIKREQMLLEQQEYQRQLVEEERQRKAAQLLSKSEATPVISRSDNEDMDEDMDVDSESDNASTTLRKHSSLLLEEVDDEEIDRYNDSISQRKPSNGGYEPIIEDK